MKFLLFSLSCLALAASGLHAIEAFSEPAGAMRVTLRGGSDTRLGLPLDRQYLYQGRIEAVDGNVITLAGTPGWTPNQWQPQGAGDETYEVLVTLGVEDGMALRIVANGTNTLQVALAGDSLADVATNAANGAGQGDIIRILPSHTPASLLGAAPLPDQTILYLYDRTDPAMNKAPAAVLTYSQAYGWYDANFAVADHLPIERGTSFIVRLPKGTPDVDVILDGQVPLTSDRKVIPARAARLDYPFSISDPIGVNIGASGLGLVDQTMLYAYDQSSAGYNQSPSAVLTYYEGYGWYDQGFNIVDNTFILAPGAGYVLRMPSVSSPTNFVVSRLPDYVE
ncbi:MAG: TIGR02597 family protein [Verrucomicrobiota bacterium JB022]|nr:TIGR02597 family protein [Verrucomicrobiota bacterium JB022]